jgi:hypothetical protein
MAVFTERLILSSDERTILEEHYLKINLFLK